jgi:hypothetical protein
MSSTCYSIATQRRLSLMAARRQHPTSSERAHMTLQLLKAVGELHTRGSAHGKLHTRQLITKYSQIHPFFLSGLEFAISASSRSRMVNSQINIHRVRSEAWDRGGSEWDQHAIGGIIVAYDSGTHIDSELMLVKDDREMDARDSSRNAQDDKHLQLIGRGTLRGPAAPRGRRLLHDISMSHLSSRGVDILLMDDL